MPNGGKLTLEALSMALGILERYSIKVDLMLTDVVMPVMNGRELFDGRGRCVQA